MSHQPEYHSTFDFGPLVVQYPIDTDAGVIGLSILPAEKAADVVERRPFLSGVELENVSWGNELPAWKVDPLVHLHRRGDTATGGFGQGRTMRHSGSTAAMEFSDQSVARSDGMTSIVTTLRSDDGSVCEHHLTHGANDAFVRVWTVYRNEGDEPVTLEMLTSFSLSGISPFAVDDAPDRLALHRFRSVWSLEGRHTVDALEHIHQDRSWSGHVVDSERFGQVGSMPCRGFFPTAAVEDKRAGVLWGAQLAWAGSWQMELSRTGDFATLSGGLADFEFGHWAKTVAPGESFTAPEAVLSCAAGHIDDLCDRFVRSQLPAALNAPAVERDLPVCFNEWCTSWGKPSHDRLVELADSLSGHDCKYLVIDAGWYRPPGREWHDAQGDWEVNPDLYPHGMRATADAIRERGFVPGLWFEMETAGVGATVFSDRIEHLLHRHGRPITIGPRRFWDMADPWVIDYLTERVIGLLRDTGMGYVKIDYNETIGVGRDDPDSLGEGLRMQTQGTYEMFRRLREALPDLVIENCSSGGHRLEPSMQALASMGSFSDAHECEEIPIIAANLQRLIHPRQSLIWAVLRKGDTPRRLVYSLAATFLGRVCLSGDAFAMSPEQWAIVDRALALYREVSPIIADGFSRIAQPGVTSYRHPAGWQHVVRASDDGAQALVVTHRFAGEGPAVIDAALPDGKWEVAGVLTSAAEQPVVVGNALRTPLDEPFSAAAVWLGRV